MAIRIPILTSFDPKGLKQANAAFAGLQGSIGSLGRNFAVVGAGLTATTALLGKAVMSASNFEAEFEGVNQVFKDAAGSVQAFAEQASKSAGISATEALQASKTFGLFATGAGLGAEEAAKFSTTMVQLAGDLGSFNDVPTEEALAAIQSGLMGQAEPLRKFGVFLDDARLKAEALNMGIYNGTGPLSTQQKMMASYSAILAQTTVQQGDFVKYGDTLGNQLKTISSDFENLTKDIGLMLIPVITEAMPVIKEMATEIGEKLKAAVASIDWRSLIQSVLDFTTFLVENAETIARVIAAVFLLNTAFKLMAVASGIVKTAIALQTWFTAQLATGTTLATIATNLLSSAMRLIPFVAVIAGLAVMIDSYSKTKTAIEKTIPALGQFETETIAVANAAALFSPYLSVIKQIIFALLDASDAAELFHAASSKATSNDAANRNRRHALRDQNRRAGLIGSGSTGFAMPNIQAMLDAAAGSAGAVSIPTFDTSALDQQQKDLIDGLNNLNDAQAQAANKEQEILDKRQSAFESFTDSVKSLFGQIKDSILSSFNLPTLGNSVNSITRNISKLLERTKGFARSISQLSGMGLNSALLQQVIQAGPMAGSQLASALVGGGAGFISQINRAYGEFGDLAGGIAGTGTTSAFGGQQTINNYSIEVTGGLATGSDVGRAVVNAIRDFERTSGAAWRA
jgi:hypothetical protein